MKWQIVGLFFLVSFQSQAQSRFDSSLTSMELKESPGFSAFVYSGIFFYGLTDKETQPFATTNFCDSVQRVFLLDSLKLSEKSYLSLGLRKKHLDEKSAKYIYKTSETSKSCIKVIELSVNTRIKINFNGLNLVTREDKEKALSSILEANIISIKCHSRLFGSPENAILEIKTK